MSAALTWRKSFRRMNAPTRTVWWPRCNTGCCNRALKDDQARALSDFLSARGKLNDADIRPAIRLVMATPEYQVT